MTPRRTRFEGRQQAKLIRYRLRWKRVLTAQGKSQTPHYHAVHISANFGRYAKISRQSGVLEVLSVTFRNRDRYNFPAKGRVLYRLYQRVSIFFTNHKTKHTS